jgi:hypothetical protein
VCSEACGARVVSSGSWLNWTGPRTTLNGAAVAGFDLDDHVVGHGLLIGAQIDEALERRPLAPHGLEVLTPVLERLAADGLGDELHTLLAFWMSGMTSLNRGSSASSAGPGARSIPDVAGRADDAQVDDAAVGGDVVGHERVHRRDVVGHHRAHGLAGLHALRDAGAGRPPRGGQQGHVEFDRSRPCAPDGTARPRCRRRCSFRRSSRRTPECPWDSAPPIAAGVSMPDATAGPERGAVEAADVAPGPLSPYALPRA